MDETIFDRWASLPDKAEVALLSAPFTFPPSPSIALCVFKSCLTEAGISSRVLYPVFPLIRTLGMENSRELAQSSLKKGVNDFLFAHLTDVSNEFDERSYVEAVFCDRSEEWRESFAERLAGYRRTAAGCVDMIARRLVNMGVRVVAASSVFSQQNAILAVFRRVKELAPDIATIIGGFNVGGEMGACVLRHYPSVDYVFFGDGDEVFAEVVRAAETGSPMPYGVLGREDLSGPMPYGVLGRKDLSGPMPSGVCRREDLSGGLPFRLTRNMDTVPTPDYSDFFEEIAREREGVYGQCLLAESTAVEEPVKKYPPSFERIVYLEGSRGCAWGQKQACAFCSGNGFKL